MSQNCRIACPGIDRCNLNTIMSWSSIPPLPSDFLFTVMHICITYICPSTLYVCMNVCVCVYTGKLLPIECTQYSDCGAVMARYDIPCADHFNSWMQWHHHHHHHHHHTAVEWCMNGVIMWLHWAVTCMAPCYCCNAHDNVNIFRPSLQSNPSTRCICVVFCMWIREEGEGKWVHQGKGGNFFVCI